MSNLMNLEPPYFVSTGSLPGIDFNRELIEPATNETFPDGAVGIRVDDDFWAVAALPWSCRDRPLAELVRELWPQYAEDARLCPDHGTQEQEVYHWRGWAKSVERMNDVLQEKLHAAHDEVRRLRAERPPLQPRIEDRLQAEKSYFIRQYEHLLVAVAHDSEPRTDAPGICARCGLYGTDRVHDKHYIELHGAGYNPAIKHLIEYGYHERLECDEVCDA